MQTLVPPASGSGQLPTSRSSTRTVPLHQPSVPMSLGSVTRIVSRPLSPPVAEVVNETR